MLFWKHIKNDPPPGRIFSFIPLKYVYTFFILGAKRPLLITLSVRTDLSLFWNCNFAVNYHVCLLVDRPIGALVLFLQSFFR